jgi:signal transduction histidine kinase
VGGDFEKRKLLQEKLQQKDEAISERILTIQNIASKISSGDYSIRVTDEQSDNLGSLSVSLNKMAQSLERSFNDLAYKEWLQAGIAGLNEEMKGEQDIESLAAKIVEFVATYTESAAGALYLLDNKKIEFTSGYAFTPPEEKKIVETGEGIIGQCVQSKKEILVKNISSDSITINYTGGEVKPTEIIAFPLFFGNRIKGAIELASTKGFIERDLAFFKAVSHSTGIVINTAKNRQRMQELLEETQSQSEELQNINAELEAQAQKLQVSEEELKVQHEELMQANGELEERTRLLEEKNQLIAERTREIQQKAEELELSSKYKSEFLANMSHELRTPLNSILLLSRLLQENNEENLSDTQTEYATVIHSSGQGLLSLIDEILDLSKIEAGKMELEYSAVRIEEVVTHMKDLFAPQANEKKISLDFAVAENVPAIMETDPMRLEQILKNLLSNALKFTSHGTVSLSISGNNNEVMFAVKDTGIGIAKEKQALIFEAFQQADGSTRRKYGGTGLGLSISRELVRLLGGEISVMSEPGKGSTFTISLPVKKAQVKPEIKVSNTSKKENIIEKLFDEERESKGNEVRYISSFIPHSVEDDRETLTD